MEDNISGGTVNYDIVGEGIPIVMLHGGPGDLLYMRGLIENIPQATFAVLDRASHFLSYCRAVPLIVLTVRQ